jgi:hypothetical protein
MIAVGAGIVDVVAGILIKMKENRGFPQRAKSFRRGRSECGR